MNPTCCDQSFDLIREWRSVGVPPQFMSRNTFHRSQKSNAKFKLFWVNSKNSQKETQYYRNSHLFSKTSKIADDSFSKIPQWPRPNNSFYSRCCPIMIFLSHRG